MSFSSDIKNELCKLEFKRECCLRAECYGAWLFSKCFTLKEAAFVTENGAVARRMLELAAAGAGVSGELSFGVSRRKKPAYRVGTAGLRFPGSHAPGVWPHGQGNQPAAEPGQRGKQLLRGGVPAGGVSHLRHGHRSKQGVPFGVCSAPQKLANDLYTLLCEVEAFPLSPAVALRKGGYVVYMKESGPIEDLLTYLGAPGAAMELMQVKMYKEVKNNINRKTNFETANMDKTYSASARQVAAIAAISDTQGLGSLPEELEELARLRLDHPDMTLRELGQRLGITRSGVNHGCSGCCKWGRRSWKSGAWTTCCKRELGKNEGKEGGGVLALKGKLQNWAKQYEGGRRLADEAGRLRRGHCGGDVYPDGDAVDLWPVITPAHPRWAR